jgi:hypothetical protein
MIPLCCEYYTDFPVWFYADCTMPFDNIKTRMQALGAESRYSNSLDCFTKVRSTSPCFLSSANPTFDTDL